MRVITVTIILITIMFAGVPSARGQSTSPDGERIRKLREEIRKRETAEIPDDLVDLNRSKLIERRAELRTLLKNELAKLQKHQAEMKSFISPEETERIKDAIQTYSAELAQLVTEMQKDLSADASASNGVASNPSPPSNDTNAVASNASGDGTNGSPDGAPVGSSSAASTGTTSATAPANPAPALTPDLTDAKETLDCDAVEKESVPTSEIDKVICGLVSDVRDRSDNKLEMFGKPDWFRLVKILIAKKFTPNYLVEASEARLDKQLGASSQNGVSPSLVTHGGVPFILGFAVENGGLEQTTNGTAITFRGNPVGLFNALRNKGFLENVKETETDPLQRFLKKTSFAFTFNTDRGREPGVFTGSSQQLSSISARIELINRRVPTLYIKEWENFIANEADRLTAVVHKEAEKIVTDRGKWTDGRLQNWFDQMQVDLGAASDTQVSGVLQAAINNIPLENLEPTTATALQAIEESLRIYQSGRDDIVRKINNGLVLTFDYLNKRDVNLPDTSNFMVIAEKGTAGGGVSFTFNGSFTIFNNMDSLRNFIIANPTAPKARRVRDFQFAGGFDIPFGNVRQFGQFVLFASGKYERLLENATTDIGQVLPNTTGDIGQIQFGLKIPVAKSGFKIPVSITFANRTELIKERTVKGNFGFSLDLDTIFSRFKPF